MLKQNLQGPLNHLQRLTSLSAKFQEITGTPGDDAAALLRVHQYLSLDDDGGALEATLTDPLPRVSLYLDSYEFQKQTTSGGRQNSGLVWMPELEVAAETARSAEGPAFLAVVETILDEMHTASLTAGELNVIETRMLTPPTRADPVKNNGRKFWFLALQFEVSG